MFSRNRQNTFSEVLSPDIARKTVRERARDSYISRGLFTLAGLGVAAIAMLSLSDDVGNREIEAIGDISPKVVLVTAGLAELGIAAGAVTEKRRAIRAIGVTASDHEYATHLVNCGYPNASQLFYEESYVAEKKRSLAETAKDIGGQTVATGIEIFAGGWVALAASNDRPMPQHDENATLLMTVTLIMAAGAVAAANEEAVHTAKREALRSITAINHIPAVLS